MAAEQAGAIAGISVTATATAVFHASEASQGLLEHPVVGHPIEVGQESHAAGILLGQAAGAGLSRWGQTGGGGRHKPGDAAETELEGCCGWGRERRPAAVNMLPELA